MILTKKIEDVSETTAGTETLKVGASDVVLSAGEEYIFLFHANLSTDGTTVLGGVRLYEDHMEAAHVLDQAIKVGANGQYHDCFGAYVGTPGSGTSAEAVEVYYRSF